MHHGLRVCSAPPGPGRGGRRRGLQPARVLQRPSWQASQAQHIPVLRCVGPPRLLRSMGSGGLFISLGSASEARMLRCCGESGACTTPFMPVARAGMSGLPRAGTLFFASDGVLDALDQGKAPTPHVSCDMVRGPADCFVRCAHHHHPFFHNARPVMACSGRGLCRGGGAVVLHLVGTEATFPDHTGVTQG